MPGARWPLAVQDEAVRMYLDGKKYDEITAETGVPMATIISWLHKREIVPNRQRRAAKPDLSASALMERNEALVRENERLKAEVRYLKQALAEKLEGLSPDLLAALADEVGEDVPQVTS